jgi:hypothetical protein
MCYTTISHFTHCSHRTSTITLCPRAIQHRPTIYQLPRGHAEPCAASGREGGIFVSRDRLCDACRRVNSWFAAGGGGGGGGSKNYMTDRPGPQRTHQGPAVRTTGGSPHCHHSRAMQDRWEPRRLLPSRWTQCPRRASDDCRCPRSEAFERPVTHGDGHGDGSVFSRGQGEGIGGTDHARDGKREREYGPFMLHRAPSGAGLGSDEYGGYAARKTRGEEKQVRFVLEPEVLYFRRELATSTLKFLSRDEVGCR